MPKGSGIATYAWNLGLGLKRQGFETQLLFGPARAARGHALLDEIAIYDAVELKPSRPTVRQFLRKRFSGLTKTASRVARSGEIDPRQWPSRDFGADVIWSSQDLFHGANRDYAGHGRFTTVTFGAPGEPAPMDAMHWTCVLPLKAQGAANVYTIHDLVPLKLPFATLDDKPRFFETCAQICKQADHVVTVSETSRREIIRIFGIEESRITNTFQAVNIPDDLLAESEDEAAAEVAALFGLDWNEYFVFFGAVEPKKNIGRLIEAYLTAGVRKPLVIIGGRAWLEGDETRLLTADLIQTQAAQTGASLRTDRVRRFDYLPRQALINVIRGARATLFPSLYEGFGLPILESMQLGTAVLTSTEGAGPEIAGDAAVFVDPYDVRAIKRAIQALDADDGLCDDLTHRGRLQAAKFAPAEYERRLSELYRGLL